MHNASNSLVQKPPQLHLQAQGQQQGQQQEGRQTQQRRQQGRVTRRQQGRMMTRQLCWRWQGWMWRNRGAY